MVADEDTSPDAAGTLAREIAQAQDEATRLERELQASRTVGVAVGLVMERLRIGEGEAQAAVEALARAEGLELETLAATIVEHGGLPPAG